MPSQEFNDKTRDPNGSENREKRKKVIRVKRKSSSRQVADDDGTQQDRSSSTRESTPVKRKTSMPIPELNRRRDDETSNVSRASLPYPTFSKAHSREAVGSKENLAPSRKDVFTPDPTDLQEQKEDEQTQNERRGSAPPVHVQVPPSPPLTATEPLVEARASPSKVRRPAGERRDDLRRASNTEPRRGSPLSATKSQETSSRRASARTVPILESTSSLPTRSPNRRDYLNPTNPPNDTATPASSVANSTSTSATSKQETRTQSNTIHRSGEVEDDSSPETSSDISVRTPTPRGTPAPASYKQYTEQTYPISQPNPYVYASPVPPPPPPPPPMYFQPPRVDYLMQHGGLHRAVPKRFINAPAPDFLSSWVAGELPNPTDMARRVDAFFAPFRDLLESYTKVISKTGSIAVATGYRSIARRLLDRLEAVFARDISSETCACLMCDTPDNVTLDDERGVSWGEILEYVSGRRELPQWPPFVLSNDSADVALPREALKSPCQTLDIDVPEEYREHYIRQSKKTKESVDQWLACQNVNTSTPPEEADDDTLTFAILTHLEPALRPIYKEILGITNARPNSVNSVLGSRGATPVNTARSEIVVKSTLAIRRLYRLASGPRAPEVATFLVNNQHLHNVLATLAAVSDAEWDILISGRFDGFLRSGAGSDNSPSFYQTNGLSSRGPTPLPLHAPSAASLGAPVAIDEETEIAVLAEVEREIFTGMEALEDAFENLHTSAESVRRILRERGAGLAMAAQARRGSAAGIVEARLGTPASAINGDSERDDWLDDTLSELAPDDSASMISKNRIRRKRRDERRTPAPIDEEVEVPEMQGFSRGGGVGNSTSRNSYRRR